MPSKKRYSRLRRTELRRTVDAVLCIVSTGCQWRVLPCDVPPYTTVQGYFYAWLCEERWEAINHVFLMLSREQEGCEATPSVGILDRQSVKTAENGGPRGYDAGKKIKGSKRHIATDTLGHLIVSVMHAANLQDRDGAPRVAEKIRPLFPWLCRLIADGGYAGEKLRKVLAQMGDWVLDIVKRSDRAQGFVRLPKRRIVERTVACLGRCRCLNRDVEATLQASQAWLISAECCEKSLRVIFESCSYRAYMSQ